MKWADLCQYASSACGAFSVAGRVSIKAHPSSGRCLGQVGYTGAFDVFFIPEYPVDISDLADSFGYRWRR